MIDVGRTFNADVLVPPLSDAVVITKAKSAWGFEQRGENLFGRGQAVLLNRDKFDKLAYMDSDAFTLMYILKSQHWGRPEFFLSNAMHESLGWTLRRFRAARDTLATAGHIHCINAGGKGKNDPPVYGWAKVSEIALQ